jgi:hypothetical protein
LLPTELLAAGMPLPFRRKQWHKQCEKGTIAAKEPRRTWATYKPGEKLPSTIKKGVWGEARLDFEFMVERSQAVCGRYASNRLDD